MVIRKFSVLFISILILVACGGGGGTPPGTNNDTNNAPVANAGDDQYVESGVSVTLNGGVSSDPDGNSLSYQWSFLTVPDNSTLIDDDILNQGLVTPSFTPDVPGSYIISLVVSDGKDSSLSDAVVINAFYPLSEQTQLILDRTELLNGNEINSQMSLYSVATDILGTTFCIPNDLYVAPDVTNIPAATLYGCGNSISTVTYTLAADNSTITFSLIIPELYIDLLSGGEAGGYITRTNVSYEVTIQLENTGNNVYRYVTVVSSNLTLGNYDMVLGYLTVNALQIRDAVETEVESILTNQIMSSIFTDIGRFIL